MLYSQRRLAKVKEVGLYTPAPCPRKGGKKRAPHKVGKLGVEAHGERHQGRTEEPPRTHLVYSK